MKHVLFSTLAAIVCVMAVIFCYSGEKESNEIQDEVIEKQYSPTAMDVDVIIKHLPRTAMDVEILVKHPHFSAFESEAFPISRSVNA